MKGTKDIFVNSETMFKYRKSECIHIRFREVHCCVNFVQSFTAIEGCTSFLTDILRRCVNGGKQIWFLTVPSGCSPFYLSRFEGLRQRKGASSCIGLLFSFFIEEDRRQETKYTRANRTSSKIVGSKVKLRLTVNTSRCSSQTLLEENITSANPECVSPRIPGPNDCTHKGHVGKEIKRITRGSRNLTRAYEGIFGIFLN